MTEAIRGEGATLHDSGGERFVDELAPRDEVSRAIQARLQDVRRALGGARHARRRPRPLPERRGLPARGRPGSEERADPRRAGRPLHDGRDRRRPSRPLHACRAVCGRRVLLHGSARRQPPGLELPERVLRVRPPRDRPCPLAPAETPVASPSEQELAELLALGPMPSAEASTRAALWQDAGIVRSAEGLGRLLDDPHPLARLIARCALERTESRGAHRRIDYPELDHSFDHRHVVVGPGGGTDRSTAEQPAAAAPSVPSRRSPGRPGPSPHSDAVGGESRSSPVAGHARRRGPRRGPT